MLEYRWLQNIYYASVYPYLLYDIEIYVNTYASYLDKLVKIRPNNKILRILLNQPIRTPVSVVCKIRFIAYRQIVSVSSIDVAV